MIPSSSSAANKTPLDMNFNFVASAQNPFQRFFSNGIFPPTLTFGEIHQRQQQALSRAPSAAPSQDNSNPPVLEDMSQASSSEKKPKRRRRKRGEEVEDEHPRLERQESEDLQMYQGPLNQRKIDGALAERLNNIKEEPLDDYEDSVPHQQVVHLHRVAQQATPPQIAPIPALRQLGIDERALKKPQSKNEIIYAKLQKSYPKWRYETTEKAILEFQKNCIIKRQIAQLTNSVNLQNELNLIDYQFTVMKNLAMSTLTDEQNAKLFASLLENLANWTWALCSNGGVRDVRYFINTISRGITNPNLDVVIKYDRVRLPSPQEVDDTVEEAFNKVDKGDLPPSVINFIRLNFKQDWSDPWHDLQLTASIAMLSHIPQIRVLEILSVARYELRLLITERNYYWSIDTDLPVLN